MDWSYVAGYFDGEGHVSLHKTKRGDSSRGLSWYNTDKPSLDAICEFMGVGKVTERLHGLKKKRAFILDVRRKADILHVLDHMAPHLLIKKTQADMLRAYVVDHVDESRMVNYGKVAAVSTEQLVAWYDSGLSHFDIARQIGVSRLAVAQAFRVRGIKSRQSQEASRLKTAGVPKSAETIERMRAVHQRNWSDPEYRAKQALFRDKNNQTRAERFSASIRAKWADPEFRERMRAVRKAQWANPETRAVMTAAQRARREREKQPA